MSTLKRAYTKLLSVSTTGGLNSTEISVEGNNKEVHLMVSGMTDGDGNAHIEVNQSPDLVDANDDWIDYYISGTQQVITSDAGSQNTGVVLRAPGTYRVVKPATSVAGVVLAVLHHKIPVN